VSCVEAAFILAESPTSGRRASTPRGVYASFLPKALFLLPLPSICFCRLASRGPPSYLSFDRPAKVGLGLLSFAATFASACNLAPLFFRSHRLCESITRSASRSSPRLPTQDLSVRVPPFDSHPLASGQGMSLPYEDDDEGCRKVTTTPIFFCRRGLNALGFHGVFHTQVALEARLGRPRTVPSGPSPSVSAGTCIQLLSSPWPNSLCPLPPGPCSPWSLTNSNGALPNSVPPHPRVCFFFVCVLCFVFFFGGVPRLLVFRLYCAADGCSWWNHRRAQARLDYIRYQYPWLIPHIWIPP